MKICSKCGPKDESCFAKRSSSKDGLQSRCKDCYKDWHEKHYQAHTQYYKDKRRRHRLKTRSRNLQFIIDYLKQHPCVDCGEQDPIVLEFDHINEDKSFSVSQKVSDVSLELIQKEISKCEVRCANCHRRKTAKQLQWYKDINL